MKPSNHKPCQTQHFKHFWHGTGEVVWPLSVLFDCFLLPQVAALWNQAVEFSAAWPAGEATPLADYFFSTNQTIKPCKTHDVSILWHGLGSRGSVSPCSLTGSFYFGLFIILLPPVAALWNQTVEFWHGQQGGGLTPFTDWIVLFFQQAKPSNNVYFWFFEEEVVWPHYLECWSFFDRCRHAKRSKQWNQGELPISPFFVWQPAWKEDKFKQTNGRWSDLPTPLWRNCSV